MKRIIFILVLISVLILVPFGIQQLIQYRQLPSSITIATGKEGGRYKIIAEALGERVQSKYGIEVIYTQTLGAQENVKKIQNGEADFALFQPNILSASLDCDNVRLIANVFPEVVLAHVRKDLSHNPFLGNKEQRASTTVAIGEPGSGDSVTGNVILDFFDGGDSVIRKNTGYQEIVKGFKSNEIDLAIVTTEQNALIQKQIADSDVTRLLDLPFADSFVAKNPDFHIHKVPAGFYGVYPDIYPEKEIQTIAVNAQLITNSEVSAFMVTAMAEIMMDPDFLSSNNLTDLRFGGNSYASANPSLPFHSGADHFYDPEIKPLLNPDFVDSTESLRSFFVSVLIAVYLIFRWFRARSRSKQEHHLDKYLRRLLEIEKEQVELDENGSSGDEIIVLEDLLDEVTSLRRKALISFSANDFRDDSGAECFLLLSNSLSQKINSKLTRQKICKEIMIVSDQLKEK